MDFYKFSLIMNTVISFSLIFVCFEGMPVDLIYEHHAINLKELVCGPSKNKCL